MKKVFVIIILSILTSCTKEQTFLNKDVSFLFPVKCTELYVSDSFAGEVVNTIHLADVDTAVVKFKMKYGTHNIVMTADGNTISREFTVSDSTLSLYEFTPLTISVVVDDAWDGYIIYKGQ